MCHPRRFKAGSRTTFGVVLVLLLLFVSHSAPGPAKAARRARAEEQSTQIPSIPPGQAYRNRNLVSSLPGLAYVQDPFVVSPWGISLFGGLTVDTTTHTALRYTIFIEPQDFHLGTMARGVPPITLPGGSPTGVIQPIGTSFANVIAVTAAGEVVGWNFNQGSNVGQVLASQPGHSYTGVAFAESNVSGSNAHYLYAADFANGKIDVFNTSYVLQTSGFAFNDPTVPADFHPYNIEFLRDVLFVTYAKVGPGGQPQTGAGLGYIRTFNPNGTLSPFFKADGGQLNAPWGVTVSSSAFGVYANRVLVGNTGDGTICVFDFLNTFVGRLPDEAGQPIVIEGLRAITMGQSATSMHPFDNTLFYSSDHGLLGSLVPTTSTATSLVQLAGDSVSIGEGVSHIDITATRAGDVSGAATVNYAAFDRPRPGRASQKSDYEAAAGTLAFAPGETSKTFRVFIVNDNLVEGDETVSLALSNPTGTGVGLGSPNTGELKILDNDTTTPTTNPSDTSDFFVRQHYLDFLNREPDAAGLQFWINEIEQCGADAQCREVKRINVSAAFFLSIEFQRTGLLAYLTHKAVFGTRPSYGAFVRDVQPLQQNLVFGQPGFDAQLEANKQAYFNGFVLRPDYLRNAPGGVTPAEFVDRLYERAGVTPTTAERDAAIAEFGGASNTGDFAAQARVLRRVAETPAFAQAEFNRAFVAMEYFGYLRRDPDDAGYQFWLDKLNQFNGNFIQAEMVKAFITSAEYRQRFGP